MIENMKCALYVVLTVFFILLAMFLPDFFSEIGNIASADKQMVKLQKQELRLLQSQIKGK